MSQHSAPYGKPDSNGFFGAYGGQFVPEPLKARLDEVAEAMKAAEADPSFQKELDYLWREKRPDTTRKVTWAASLGDRSENADYAQAPQRNYYFQRTP